jgi:hypothetical protein
MKSLLNNKTKILLAFAYPFLFLAFNAYIYTPRFLYSNPAIIALCFLGHSGSIF